MVQIYVKLINAGLRTLEDVMPKSLRDEVEAELNS